jgi:hypothetical protein
VDKSLLKAKLNQLEARLQAIVEGSAAMLFPLRGERYELASSLVAAMRAGIQSAGDGNWLAPNLYTLVVHPANSQSLSRNQVLLGELAEMIRQTGNEAGLLFPSPPVIRILADPEVGLAEIRVLAKISAAQIGETSTLAVEPDDPAGSIPANAFLILEGAQIFPLNGMVINIGRRLDNHLVIDVGLVSRTHAQLRAINGHYVIFDLDSTGGTYVNGKRLQQCTLYPGDVISLAGVNLVYSQDADLLSADTPGSTQPINPFPLED